MSDETYEYECMRAELLGTQRPSLEEYLDKQEQLQIAENEHIDIENLKELEHEGEELKGVSGRLHELSSILSNTQKKINRFKVYGSSLTNLLKMKVGFGSSSDSIVSNPDACSTQDCDINKGQENMMPFQTQETTDLVKSDLAKGLDSHVDVLDRLIDKAENCQYSMQHQNKQMKKFLH